MSTAPASNPNDPASAPASGGKDTADSSAIQPAKAVLTPAANGLSSSIFAEYEPKLFDLYTRFRYNEVLSRRLMSEALRLEKLVRWSVLVTLGISLSSGVIPGMNQATLNWIWGSFTTAATLLTIYSLAEGSSEKQFQWFQLAMRFHESSNRVEFFSAQVKRGKVDEDELANTWHAFTLELDSLIGGAGPAFLGFEAKHQDELTEELAATLRREKRAA